MMTLVWELELPDSEKLVLLALADCANDEGHCWPGMPTLTKKCSKSDRTIQLAIKMLCVKGHLTRREVVGKGCNYTVHPIVRLADPRSGLAPEVITPPKPVTQTPEAASGKPSRTIKGSKAIAFSPRPWALPVGVSLQVWTDLMTNRKRKRLPNTDTAWKGFLEDLQRVSSQTGIPPPQLIEQCTAKGWGGIYDPREQRHGQSTSNVTSLRGSRPDPALDLYRAACAAEDREDNLRAGPSLPALGSGGP